MKIHVDTRRVLYDYANGNFKSAKALVFSDDVIVGDHTHLNKDEEFLLLRGSFIEMEVGELKLKNIPAPYKIDVKRGTYHKFICRKDSILLCVASEKYNKKDEIK